MDMGCDCEHSVIDSSPLQFALLIQGAPATSDAPAAALKFAQAAVAADHRIRRAFFHGDGASIANRFAVPSEDETDVAAAWAAFARQHDVSLIVCVASAARRGATEDGRAPRRSDDDAGVMLRDGFEIGGLGQMIEAINSAHRTVTFGA